MAKNLKLSELKYSLDSGYNLKVNIGKDILTVSSLEILELSKIILTEFQSRAKMPSSALKAANVEIKSNVVKKRGRPKGSKNRKKK